jgi:hypothetical protein
LCLCLRQELFAHFDFDFPCDRIVARAAEAAIVPGFIRDTFSAVVPIQFRARPQLRIRAPFLENSYLYCEADLRFRLPRPTSSPPNANLGARVFAS